MRISKYIIRVFMVYSSGNCASNCRNVVWNQLVCRRYGAIPIIFLHNRTRKRQINREKKKQWKIFSNCRVNSKLISISFISEHFLCNSINDGNINIVNCNKEYYVYLFLCGNFVSCNLFIRLICKNVPDVCWNISYTNVRPKSVWTKQCSGHGPKIYGGWICRYFAVQTFMWLWTLKVGTHFLLFIKSNCN